MAVDALAATPSHVPSLSSPPPAPEIPDSDAENTQPPPDEAGDDAAAVKMRDMIERINHQSDDERESDQQLDFGDDEELVDNADGPAAPGEPDSMSDDAADDAADDQPLVQRGAPTATAMTAKPAPIDESAGDESAGDESAADEPPPAAPAPSTPKKKVRAPAKKGKELLPAKAIKKADTPTKARAKPGPKPKAATTKAAATKAAAKPAAKAGAAKGVAKAGLTKAKAATAKKAGASAAAVPADKGAKAAASPKTVKKKAAKPAAAAKTTTPKVKGARAAAAAAAAGGKTRTVAAAKPGVKKAISKKAATPTKGKADAKDAKAKKRTPKKKGKKEPSMEDEDEDSANVVMESEGEGDDDDGDVSADEEEPVAVRTPVKGGIIGHVACSSRDGDTRALLDHAVQMLGQYSVVDVGGEWDQSVTAYVVSKDTKRGWGVLQALATGAAIVSDEWVSRSISDGRWHELEPYHSERFGQNSPRGVATGAAGIAKMLGGLRVKVRCDGSDCASVRKLVRLCGGRVAETKMDVVINDTEKVVAGVVNVSKKWLADSIEAGVAIEYEPYVVGRG